MKISIGDSLLLAGKIYVRILFCFIYLFFFNMDIIRENWGYLILTLRSIVLEGNNNWNTLVVGFLFNIIIIII